MTIASNIKENQQIILKVGILKAGIYAQIKPKLERHISNYFESWHPQKKRRRYYYYYFFLSFITFVVVWLEVFLLPSLMWFYSLSCITYSVWNCNLSVLASPPRCSRSPPSSLCWWLILLKIRSTFFR
jgi:hypothetical protein